MTMYALTLRSLPNARTAPEQRLKGILKRLLRSYQFRCVECVEVQGGTTLVQPKHPKADQRAAAMQRYLGKDSNEQLS